MRGTKHELCLANKQQPTNCNQFLCDMLTNCKQLEQTTAEQPNTTRAEYRAEERTRLGDVTNKWETRVDVLSVVDSPKGAPHSTDGFF